MNKHIVYESQFQANNDQFWADLLCSAGAYTVYCWIGYILAALIVVWIIRTVWNSFKRGTRGRNSWDDYHRW